MNSDQVVRQQLCFLLDGGGAHMRFDEAVADFPLEQINTRPPNVPYTFWHLLEHLRITQWDILEFVRNPAHVSPTWPEGYWPAPSAQADPAQWQQTRDRFHADLHQLRQLVEDVHTDLYSDLPHAAGYTILREILLVADHNAYHIGELGILRQIMGLWPSQ
ncbi:MAG TPA: DinB family protein [Caldilineaceae bacterium]|nr:DinB family protein [Caldilineaceae bacterium]